jgi:hypothetical protein
VLEPECIQPYASCYDDNRGTLGECCEGTECIGSEATNVRSCSPTCTAHSDCATDCCVEVSEPEGLFCNSIAENCMKCINTCDWAADGFCDDGGPGADYSVCELGTDCADCGPR